MFYLQGIEENFKIIYQLSKNQLDVKIETQQDLKIAYINLLKVIQPDVWYPSFVLDDCLYTKEIVEDMISHYMLHDRAISKPIKIIESCDMKKGLTPVRNALRILSSIKPRMFDLYKMCVNTMFYNPSLPEHSGSVITAKGVVWFAYDENATADELIELITCELTTQLLFIDEYAFGYYRDPADLYSYESYGVSPLTNKRVPLYKLMHHTIAAVEILCLRIDCYETFYRPTLYPATLDLYQNCLTSFQAIKNIVNKKLIVKSRFIKILERAERRIALLKDDMRKYGPCSFVA